MKVPRLFLLLVSMVLSIHGTPLIAASARGLSERDAVQCVTAKVTLPKPEKNRVVEVDRVEKRKGRNYYVVHGYHIVIDDPKTQEGHTATFGWYFVDCSTGSVFLWDMISDTLRRP